MDVMLREIERVDHGFWLHRQGRPGVSVNAACIYFWNAQEQASGLDRSRELLRALRNNQAAYARDNIALLNPLQLVLVCGAFEGWTSIPEAR